MQRFLHVRGKAGIPVANPHIDDPLRFVGQKRTDKVPQYAELMDHFEACEEVIADHPDLAKAIKRGELIVIGKLGEHTLDRARTAFARLANTSPDRTPDPPRNSTKKDRDA